MIAYIKGKLVEAGPLHAIVDIQGIGYEIHIPVTTAECLPHIGEEVLLYTLVVYRDDSQTIYGFATKEDRNLFRLLVEKVSGIGPKIALNIMSKLSLTILQTAIANEDISLLSKCPGIGKKTAQRLIIELKDLLNVQFPSHTRSVSSNGASIDPSSSGSAIPNSPAADAVLALIQLGYKAADADKSIRKAAQSLGAEATTEALIKAALR